MPTWAAPPPESAPPMPLPCGRVLQVEPAAEALAGAGEDEAAHLGSRSASASVRRERVEHLEADRVQPLGAVERDDADAVVLLVEQVRHEARS